MLFSHAGLKAAGPWETAVGIKPAREDGARARLLRALSPVPIWAAVGALGGGLYGTVCGGVYDLIHWEVARMFSWGFWLAVAGATAGAIVGACRALDRVLNGTSGPTRSERSDDES